MNGMDGSLEPSAPAAVKSPLRTALLALGKLLLFVVGLALGAATGLFIALWSGLLVLGC